MILAGIMGIEPDGSCHVRQLFAETSKADEERLLLAELENELSNFDCISLFNLKRIKRIDPISSEAIKELREIVSEEFIQSVLDKITKIESEPEVVLLSEEMI